MKKIKKDEVLFLHKFHRILDEDDYAEDSSKIR